MLELAVEEFKHCLVGHFGIVTTEAVAGTGQREQFSLDRGGFQSVDEPLGLLVRRT